MHAEAHRMVEPAPPQGFFEVGEVVRVRADVLVVETDEGRRVEARRAASCLVEPSEGDLVALVPVPRRRMHYAVAVLDREGEGPVGICAPEGLCISVPRGRFAVVADGIDLVGERVGVRAKEVNVESQRAHWSFRELAVRGKEILAHADAFKLVGRMASAVLESAMSRVERSYRVVTELDHVSAHQISYSAKESASIHAKHSMVTAEELVKVDGKQIHIG